MKDRDILDYYISVIGERAQVNARARALGEPTEGEWKSQNHEDAGLNQSARFQRVIDLLADSTREPKTN